MKRTLTFIIGVVLAMSTAMAQQTKVLTADRHNEYGLVYSLPMTALDIEIVAERTVSKAGPYYLYAKKYLGTSDFVSADAEQWTVSSVRVTPVGVADPDRKYLMQLKAGALTSMQVADDGMLLAINTEVEAPEAYDPEEGTELSGSSLDREEYLQYVGEDFLGAQSRAKRAHMLWEALMEVRNARLALSKGTAETMPTDGRQLELMLASLQQQEQALTDAFCGTVQTQTVVSRYRFIPDEENAEQRNVLGKFSATKGFAPQGDALVLTVDDITRPELPTDDKGEVKRIPKDAVMYMLPGSAVVTIKCGAQQLYSQELPMGQFGTPFGLAPGLFTDKKAPSYAIFDPVTGALRSIGEVKP